MTILLISLAFIAGLRIGYALKAYREYHRGVAYGEALALSYEQPFRLNYETNETNKISKSQTAEDSHSSRNGQGAPRVLRIWEGHLGAGNCPGRKIA